MLESSTIPSPRDEGEEYGRSLARDGLPFPVLFRPGTAERAAYSPSDWRAFRLGMAKGYADAQEQPA